MSIEKLSEEECKKQKHPYSYNILSVRKNNNIIVECSNCKHISKKYLSGQIIKDYYLQKDK